jgi:hypothetical protein
VNEILEGDPYGLGLTGYTEAEAQRLLAGLPMRDGPRVADPVPASAACVHRGAVIETGACDLCGIRGQKFEIFSCAIHGRCSLTRRHSKIRSCAACADRSTIALVLPQART